MKKASLLSLIAVVLLGAGLRAPHLASPKAKVWDEKYYVPAAAAMVHLGVAESRGYFTPLLDRYPDGNPEHPPLGKLLIGLGMLLAGDQPLGWRWPSLVAGILSLVLFFFLTLSLYRVASLAVFSTFLLSCDFLHIVHSRIATLDGFLFMFSVLAFLALQKLAARPLSLGWQLAAGGALAAALLVKYVAVLVWVAFFFLLLTERQIEPRLRKKLSRRILSISAGLFAAGCLLSVSALRVAEWLPLGRDIVQLDFSAPEKRNAYTSFPLRWLWNDKPIWYLFNRLPRPHGIIAMGNPILWGLFIPALIYLLWSYYRRRDPGDRVLLVWIAITYLPLFEVWAFRNGDAYIYYMLPSLAPLCVAVGRLLSASRIPRWGRAAYACLVLAATVFFLPVLWGTPLHLEYIYLLHGLVPFQ